MGNALPAEVTTLIDRLDATGLLADGDHDLIAEMHALDPDGTAQLLRDMLRRGELHHDRDHGGRNA